MNPKILNLLAELNEHHVMYAIGGSMMLKLRSFDVAPKDLDIMVSEADFQRVVEILINIAVQVSKPSHPPFKTKYFTTFILDDMAIDMMAGFAYKHLEGTYHAFFDSLSITDWVSIHGIKAPLMALEEWYIMYCVMNRHKQAALIETYWKKNGLKYPHLLVRQQNLCIPNTIASKINEILDV